MPPRTPTESAPAAEAPSPSRPAEVTQRNFDPKHRLALSEVLRLLNSGHSVLIGDQVVERMADIPADYEHGEAFLQDSPQHPRQVAARKAARELREIQEGRSPMIDRMVAQAGGGDVGNAPDFEPPTEQGAPSTDGDET